MKVVITQEAGCLPLPPERVKELLRDVRKWEAGKLAALILPPGCKLETVAEPPGPCGFASLSPQMPTSEGAD
jgi:hypothetical protein